MEEFGSSVLVERQQNPYLNFHDGELEIQKKRGTLKSSFDMVVLGGMLETMMDTSVQAYLQEVNFVVLTVFGNDSMWTTIASGEPGFVRATGRNSLEIPASTLSGMNDDPVMDSLRSRGGEVDVGIIAPKLIERARHRINGTARLVDGTIHITVRTSFGNCPKYIRARRFLAPPASAGQRNVVKSRRGLTSEECQFVKSSDHFYIGSGEPGTGADTSHRGGKVGFVRVTENTLKFGEYPGNGTSMTLGNLVKHNRACIVFVGNQFSLHLAGTATVEFLDLGSKDRLDGADITVSLTVEEVCRIENGSPLFGDGVESPFNPALTGPGAPLDPCCPEGLEYAIAHSAQVAKDVRKFIFKPVGTKSQVVIDRQPGEFVTFAIPPLDVVRSYTIASSPTERDGSFEIVVKRKPGGLASNWLHDHSLNQVVLVRGVTGGGTISAFDADCWPTPKLVSPKVLMISAGIGITPMLANLRAYRDLVLCDKTTTTHNKCEFVLLHSERSLETLPVARQELDQLKEIADVTIVETKGISQRRICKAHLKAAVGSEPEKLTVLLCGPDTFMFPIKRTLIDDFGVDSAKILQDDFTL